MIVLHHRNLGRTNLFGKQQQHAFCALLSSAPNRPSHSAKVDPHSFALHFSLLTPFTGIPDTRIEGIWRQIIDVFRGGILADWSVPLYHGNVFLL
jgi:hypothetical protein